MSGQPRDAVLRVIRDHVVVTERALGETLRIGRLPDNDLVLDDSQVSGHHGRLEREDGLLSATGAQGPARWRYTDLGSTNGSSVAGGSVLHKGESVLLDEDTQLLLGNTILDLRLAGSAGAAEVVAPVGNSAADATAIPATAPTPPPAVPDTARPAGQAPPGRPRVVVVVGGRATVVPIQGSRAVIGRGAGCDVRLEDPSVSALQARLSHEDGRWLLTNLSTTNATRVGLRRVVDTEALEDGAHIIAGAADMLFVCDNSRHSAAERSRQNARALELAFRDQRLTAVQARTAQANGDAHLGEFLVSRGWISPGAWVELMADAQAPVTTRDVASEARRRRGVVMLLVLAAAAVATMWFVVAATRSN